MERTKQKVQIRHQNITLYKNKHSTALFHKSDQVSPRSLSFPLPHSPLFPLSLFLPHGAVLFSSLRWIHCRRVLLHVLAASVAVLGRVRRHSIARVWSGCLGAPTRHGAPRICAWLLACAVLAASETLHVVLAIHGQHLFFRWADRTAGMGACAARCRSGRESVGSSVVHVVVDHPGGGVLRACPILHRHADRQHVLSRNERRFSCGSHHGRRKKQHRARAQVRAPK